MLGFAKVLLFAKYATRKKYTNQTQQFKNESLNLNPTFCDRLSKTLET
jgi:hypothetical protein